MKKVSLLCAVILVAASAHAVDAKGLGDRMARFLIDQYSVKDKGFGGAEQQKDAELAAMYVAAICNSPREYREGSGPWVTEPVKLVLAQFNDDGSLKTPAKDEVSMLVWSMKALKATENEKYKPLIEKIHAKLKPPTAGLSVEEAAQKFSKFSSLPPTEQVAVLSALGHAMHTAPKSELTVDGQKIVLWQLVLNVIDAVENKTGKVSDDMRITAMATNLVGMAYTAKQ